MTFPELVERAKRQLNAGQPESRPWPESEIDLGACVMQASNDLAVRVMRDKALQPLLQQEYPVTLDGAGKGNLLTAVGSITGVAGEILVEGVWRGAVIDQNNIELHPLFSYADFIRPKSTQFAYYLIKDKATILTRAADVEITGPSDLQPVQGTITITANYTPASVTSFPTELEDLLVQALVDIVVTKVKPANANA